MKTLPRKYNARWLHTSGNVTFTAANDEAAIKKARKIARDEVHLPNTDFTLYEGASRNVYYGR